MLNVIYMHKPQMEHVIIFFVCHNFRHDAGLKWVLFFQDTNGLLFKVNLLKHVWELFVLFLFKNLRLDIK